MANFVNNVNRIESAISTLSESENDYSSVRRIIRTSLQNLAEIPNDSSSTLAEMFKVIATDSAHANVVSLTK